MEQLVEHLAPTYALVVVIGAVCILAAFIASHWALEAADKETTVDEPAPTNRYPVTHRQVS